MLQLGAQALSGGMAAFALVVCIVAWLARREAAGLLVAATLAPILVAVRALSTGLLVTLELPTLADVADVGLGLLALGCLVWVASASLIGPVATGRTQSAEAALFRRVVDVTAFVVFAAGLTGVTVRAVGASWACQGNFPDCNGLGVLPFGRDPLADIQLYHRLLAYATLTLVAVGGRRGVPHPTQPARRRPSQPGPAREHGRPGRHRRGIGLDRQPAAHASPAPGRRRGNLVRGGRPCGPRAPRHPHPRPRPEGEGVAPRSASPSGS